MNLLNVSASPHVRDRVSTREIMLDVCIAMIPTAVYGVVQFGLHALWVILVTVAAAVLSEYLWQRGMKKEVTIRTSPRLSRVLSWHSICRRRFRSGFRHSALFLRL